MTNDRSESARSIALGLLDRIEHEGAYAGLADSADLEGDARAARQVKEYVAGITRWRRWLDFLIASFYRGSFEEMESCLRQVLRIGLYDLLFLHTPPHAAINEAVELAKHAVRRGAGGLVNGILRSVQRRAGDLPAPGTGDVAEDLAIRHSHPTWMVRRWLHLFGRDETLALLQWNNTRPFYGLRFDPGTIEPEQGAQMLDDLKVEWSASPYLDDFFRVESVQPLLRAGWLAKGRCSIQDEAAGLVVRLLDPQPGETIVDACAAPGGKTVYAAQRMHDDGRILAFDVHERRAGLVRQAAETHRLDVVDVAVADARTLGDDDSIQADRVLLDVPCSGLGVLAKRADMRWRRAEEDLEDLVALQDALLDAAARVVKPGGLLLYSTCTIEPRENEERVQAFLARHREFALEPAAPHVPSAFVTAKGYYVSLPQRHGIDGAFGARLRRRG